MLEHLTRASAAALLADAAVAIGTEPAALTQQQVADLLDSADAFAWEWPFVRTTERALSFHAFLNRTASV